MYYVGTFDQYNIRELLGERVLIPYMLQNKLKKLLVILDSAPPHKAMSLIKYFSSKRIELKKIAGGLTGLVQPGDAHWISPMKR
jgi:hypothetical protein